MKNIMIAAMATALTVLLPLPLQAETGADSIQCIKSATFLAPPQALGVRQYAPDREPQIIHLALDVTPDFHERSIEATATIRFKAIAQPLQQVKLDSVGLDVHSVTATIGVLAWHLTEDKLIVIFTKALPADTEASMTVAYSAHPEQGLYFRTPEMGYKPGDTHLFSQGEEIEARHWYPCMDSPNQRLTSEITCRVPEGMTAISNGRLVSQSKDPATGLNVIHWSQEKSHSNYLISLVAGYFKELDDKYGNVPLAFFTPPSEFNEARNSFHGTKDIMEFYNREIGVPFPWDKYDQVCVNDFVAGGMENTSATTLTDRTLFTDATENIRSSESLIAHEMAHQWFGDLVTCKDWSHIWLNEGFATFYETLYNGHKHGRDAMLYELFQRARQITGTTNDSRAIVRRNYNQPGEMFDYLAYPKAAWVLHMLRCQLGEGLYRRCIKTYLRRHQYGNVVTDDLRSVIEELSGRSFDQFFDQWLYHGRQPELEINYDWDDLTKLAKISIRQVQEINSDVLLFNFPLTIRFKSSFGTSNAPIEVTKKQEDFYFPLSAAPELVRVDPEYTLLARIQFTVPRPMLYAQLADKEDVIGRLLAIEQFSTKTDKGVIAKLQETLNHDGFYGVRIEAARALRSIHTDEALNALLASTLQPDARVREWVASAIDGFYDQKAYDFARQRLSEEKNPVILSQDIRGMAGYNKPEVREAVLKLLDTGSYRNELADAAISAARQQDDPAYIPPLLEALAKQESAFTSRGFGQGLAALAYLARNNDTKDNVRQFLAGYVNDKRKTVQLAAINALGTLGDPKAIALLETFTSAPQTTPEGSAADQAIATLRAGRKPVDDFKNLRREVLDLEKANRDLLKRIEDLNKRVEAELTSHPARRSQKEKVSSPKSSG